MDKKRRFSRREFLVGSGAVLGSAALATKGVAQAPAAPSVAKKVKIQWMEWMTTEITEARMQEVLAAFYKTDAGKSIEIERISMPFGQFRDKVLANHLAGAMPDVQHLAPLWAVEFAELGALEPLNPYFDKAGKDWVANLSKSNMIPWKGRYYLLPVTATAHLLYYNVRRLEEAGLSGPPKTWEDVEKIGPKLTNPSKNQYCFASSMAVASPYIGPAYEIWQLIYQCNDTVMKNGKCNLNSRASVKALKFWLHQVYDLKIYAPGVLTNELKDAIEAFTSEVSAMFMQSPVFVRVAEGRNPKMRLGVAPLPEGETYGTYGAGWTNTLCAKSKNKDAAWEFMHWLSSPEGNSLLSTMAFMQPGNLKADMSALVKRDPRFQVALDVVKRGRVFSEVSGIPEAPNVFRILTEQIHEAANKKKTPEEAMEFATAEWNKVLAKYA